MEENGMPVPQTCVFCCAADCTTGKQSDCPGLQVNCTDEHDQMLVDARMLDVVSSPESKKTTTESYDMSTQRHSDYLLKRLMASFDKLTSFLQRLPRANSHMALHAHPAARARFNTN